MRSKVKKPLLIIIVGWALLLAPFGYYLMALFLPSPWGNDLAFGDFHGFWTHTPGMKMLGIFLAPICGYFVLRVQALGWILFAIYCLYTIIVNFLMAFRGLASLQMTLAFSFSGFLALMVYLVRKEIRAPYFNPRLRWWESAERFAFQLEVEASLKDGGEEKFNLGCQTFDISTSGCFLVTEKEFSPGQILHLKVSLMREVSLEGEVVWVSEGGERIPQGLGIRFTSNLKAIKKGVLEFEKRYSKQSELSAS